MTTQTADCAVSDEDALLVVLDAVCRHYDSPRRIIDLVKLFKQGLEAGTLPEVIQPLAERYADDPSGIFNALDHQRKGGMLIYRGSACMPSFRGYLYALGVKSKMGLDPYEFESLLRELLS